MHSKAIYAESHPSGRGLSFCSHSCVAQLSPDTPALKIAEKFYPQAILDEEGSTKPDDEPFRKYVCAKTLQAGNGGEPTLILAAYTDDWDKSFVRILGATTGGAWTQMDEVRDLGVGGDDCEIELIDVDRDGKPEIHVSFAVNQGRDSSDFMFRWNGSALDYIGPSDGSELTNVSFEDRYGDGNLALYSLGDPTALRNNAAPERPDSIYRLMNGKYEYATAALWRDTCYKSMSACNKSVSVGSRTFFLAESSTGPYVLRIVNGDLRGSRRASGARILINGVEVVHAWDLNETMRIFTVNLEQLKPEQNRRPAYRFESCSTQCLRRGPFAAARIKT
ncbi:MAG TPA: hypothetical protein VGC88_02860 [Terriglobales bacterium]